MYLKNIYCLESESEILLIMKRKTLGNARHHILKKKKVEDVTLQRQQNKNVVNATLLRQLNKNVVNVRLILKQIKKKMILHLQQIV